MGLQEYMELMIVLHMILIYVYARSMRSFSQLNRDYG